MKYHVAENWDGEDLESLALRTGSYEEAIDVFCERWPEACAAAEMHIECVFLYETLDQAKTHQEQFGGEILAIEDEDLEIENDPYENELCVRGSIDSDYINKI